MLERRKQPVGDRSETPPYRGALLPKDPTLETLRAILPDYEAMLISIMAAIADRYDRAPDYPFIDTKLDLITGSDFPADDPVRGPNAIYGWIQGRGLEALAGHCRWMRRRRLGPDLLPRLERMMRDILSTLREIRSRNAGHLFFFMTPNGDPFLLDASGNPRKTTPAADAFYGFSDIFSAKGMYAAARYLKDDEAAAEALDYIRQVDDAIWQGTFVNDQQTLDPKDPVQVKPGCHFHGPYMIQIGTAALLAGYGNPHSVELGLRLIRHELEHHVNLNGRILDLMEYDFWEANDDRGLPYREDGKVISDPGHSLECVGLILKFTSMVKQHNLADPKQRGEIARVESLMPRLLERNFANGYLPGTGGICKAFDLLSRKPVNTDMPWWNLPETMRTALYCWRLAKRDEGRRMSLHILRDCHNAFIGHFVRPDLHLMAYQTRSASGAPIPVIPATADADPGYHTGLSIIDALDVIQEAASDGSRKDNVRSA